MSKNCFHKSLITFCYLVNNFPPYNILFFIILSLWLLFLTTLFLENQLKMYFLRGKIIFIIIKIGIHCIPLTTQYLQFCPTLRSFTNLTRTSVHVNHTTIRTFKHLSSSVVRCQFPRLCPKGCSRPWPPPRSVSHLWFSSFSLPLQFLFLC